MISAFLRVLGVQGGDVENARVLRRMRMFGALVDAQVAELLAAERAARQHALHGLFDDALGEAAVEDDLAVRSLMPPGIAGVVVIDLLLALAAGEAPPCRR